MKPMSMVLLLGLLSLTDSLPVHGEARNSNHPARGGTWASCWPRVRPGKHSPSCRDTRGTRASLDGEMAAEFKGTRWWWLSGYVCGFSIVGLLVCDVTTLRASASICEEGVRGHPGKEHRVRPGLPGRPWEASPQEESGEAATMASFWGLVSVLGVVAATATLEFID